MPIGDNNTEASIRGVTTGRKNWMMIDTISGAWTSAVIYGLVETVRTNSLHIYRYFEYLLTELPKLKEFNTEEKEAATMERLLPWSSDLPEICHKSQAGPLKSGSFIGWALTIYHLRLFHDQPDHIKLSPHWYGIIKASHQSDWP